jgi:hypothetical protein
VGRAFFPLDQELELLPGSFTPTLIEHMVRLGARMTFGPVVKEIFRFTRADVSKATVRRDTEEAGQAYVEVQTAQVEAIEKELPASPQGPPLQQISVDGANVPLLHGEWAEVRTLAVGVVGQSVLVKGEWEVHTTELSYFSRLAKHEPFARLATVETHRRGTETAGKVCAVNDGADWEQGFVDYHRPDAVRILDWGHSSEYVAKAGQAVFGAGTSATSEWVGEQLQGLSHGDPRKVLAELRRLQAELAGQVESGGSSEALKVVTGSLGYLEKRQEQIRYAEFRAAGYPIGSGAVESANKLVVEVRMKGAGMHWAREHVDPMLALRNTLCSDRWDEAWQQISQQLRRQAMERPAERRLARKAAQRAVVEPQRPVSENLQPISKASEKPRVPEAISPGVVASPASGPRRPTANHPWRRMPVGRAKYTPDTSTASAES